MVTLDLADLLQVDEAGSGLVVEAVPGTRASDLPPVSDNLGHPGPGGLRTDGRGSI